MIISSDSTGIYLYTFINISVIYTQTSREIREIITPVMPPKSRKRNKGKDRKAKKAGKVEIERASANEFWQAWYNMDIICKHGNDTTIADDHPVSKFLDEFFVLWERKQKSFTTLNDTTKTPSSLDGQRL